MTGAQFEPQESTSALIRALVASDVQVANTLLDQGADAVRGGAKDPVMPLYVAQQHIQDAEQRHKMVRRLLAAGARATDVTQDGTTALILAALEGDVGSVEIMLEHGADPMHQNEQGYNAVMAAEHGEHSKVIQILQDHMKSKSPKEL